MALVVITVLDDDDGKVDVKMLTEPPLNLKEQGKPTPAQEIAVRMLMEANRS